MSNKERNIVTRADASLNGIDEEKRTVDVVFATGYPVRRYNWRSGIEFMEVLGFDEGEVRMERMEKGVAPVLDNHDNWRGTNGQLGVVEGARLENGQGLATLRFASTPDVENTWTKVREGIVKAVSVGYQVHRYEDTGTDHENGLPIYRAVDWEPLEVSVVPVPADPDSKGRGLKNCIFVERSIEVVEEETKSKQDNEETSGRDAPLNKQKTKSMNLKDLKASRKAMEVELETLNALSEMDDTQKARMKEVIAEVKRLSEDIEAKEEAERLLASRAVAPESTSEEREIKKMKESFSITGAVRSLIDHKGLPGVAKEMREQAIAEGHTGSGDIIIPGSFVAKRAGDTDDFQAGSGDGSGFVATNTGPFIEGLTAPLEIESWGTMVMRGLNGNVQFPRESVKAIATAEGEVDTGADSTAEMDELTLTPNRYSNTTAFSKQLMYQATESVEGVIAGILARGHQRTLLSDIFTGSAGITGITGITGVNDIAATDTADYKAIVAALEQAVLEDHGLTEGCRFVLSPSAYEYISQAANVANVQALIDNGLLKGYTYHKTPYLADASAGVGQAVFGDWSNAVLAYFGAIDLVVDPYSAKANAQIQITMNQFVDFNLMQPSGFAFENGITVS